LRYSATCLSSSPLGRFCCLRAARGGVHCLGCSISSRLSRTGCCVTVQPALARVARTRCPARAAVLQHDIAKFILTFDTKPKDRWKKTKDDLNWSMARNTSRLGSKHVKTFWQICSSCVSAWKRTLRAFPDQTQSRLTSPSRTRCPHTCVPQATVTYFVYDQSHLWPSRTAKVVIINGDKKC
jgi:hypothetical protein